MLPPGFFDRVSNEGPGYVEAIQWLTEDRPKRQNHWPALTLALISQAEAGLSLLPGRPDALDDVFSHSGIAVEQTVAGRVVNTLNFLIEGAEPVTLRGRYNAAMDVIRNRMRRWGHPSNPGHATQSWRAYRVLIGTLWAMDPHERLGVVLWVWENGVLSLEETKHVADVASADRPFERVLAEMPTDSGSHGGALWQAICFGYLRADSPNLTLESIKAQTGSRHAGLVGDIDGYSGENLLMAVECKDRALDGKNWEPELGDFMMAVAGTPGVTSVVMASDATTEAREALTEAGLTLLTRQQMAASVAVWDETKQDAALRGALFYLRRIQKSEALLSKMRTWCEHKGLLQPKQATDP